MVIFIGSPTDSTQHTHKRENRNMENSDKMEFLLKES